MDVVKLIIKIYRDKLTVQGPYKIYIITLPHNVDFNKLFAELLSEEAWPITDSYYNAYFIQNVFNQGASSSVAEIILSIYRDIPIEEILSFISNKAEPTVFAIAGIKWLFTKALSFIKKSSNEGREKPILKYQIKRVTKREKIIERVSHYRLTQSMPCKVITKKEVKTLNELVIAELEDDITN